MDETESHVVGRIVLNFRDDVGPASAYSLLLAENIPDLTGKTVVAETTMEQKDHLQLLSADELWSLREDVEAKLATILLERRSMLDERLERLQPLQIQRRAISRSR